MKNELPHPISVKVDDDVVLVQPGQEIPTTIAAAPVTVAPEPLTQTTPVPQATYQTTAVTEAEQPVQSIQTEQPTAETPVTALASASAGDTEEPVTAVASPAVQAKSAHLVTVPTPLLDSVPTTAKLIAITEPQSAQPADNGGQPLSNGDAAKAQAVKAESEVATTRDLTPKSEADLAQPLNNQTPATTDK